MFQVTVDATPIARDSCSLFYRFYEIRVRYGSTFALCTCTFRCWLVQVHTKSYEVSKQGQRRNSETVGRHTYETRVEPESRLAAASPPILRVGEEGLRRL